MDSEKRQHTRTPLTTRIRLSHPSVGALILRTRDLSHGGLYAYRDGHQLPGVGSVVEVQVQDTPEEAPIVTMEIVREDDAGVGLRFC
jgi:hypothetical protein